MKPLQRVIDFFMGFKQKPPVLFPYLAVLVYACNQVTFLYQQFDPSLLQVFLEVLLLIVFAFGIHLLSGLLIRQRLIAGIIAGYIALMAVYYMDIYNHVYEQLPWVAKYITRGYNVFLGGIMLLAGTGLFFILKRFTPKLRHINNYLSILFGIFIFIECGKTFFYKSFDLEYVNLPTERELRAPEVVATRPDIYYIVFDSYTSSASLKKYWKFDNSRLDSSLKSQGFFLASGSASNYDFTQYSIASCLNMSYLNLSTFEQSVRTRQVQIDSLPGTNVVSQFLIDRGYEIRAFSMFDFMGIPNYFKADHSCPSVFERTIFSLLKVKLGLREWLRPNLGGMKNLEMLGALETYASKKQAGPAFVYAHIFLPHDPFFFDAQGNEMPYDYSFGGKEPEKYLAQLKFVNTLIVRLAGHLIKESGGRAIIIIQGDHGFRYLTDPDGNPVVDEGTSILNAYYFPDKDYRVLYDSITPVNSFRLIFNKYFGTHLAPLPDTSYHLLPERTSFN